MKTATVIALPLAAALLTLAGCGGGGGGSAPPTGLQPTLASIQANVFSVSCALSGCHTGAGAPFGLQLDPGFSYGNLIDVPSPRDSNLIRVVPGDPDASFLIQKLDGTQTLGERMPDGGPYLTTATINVIRKWIQDGAQQ
jgi:hypothetical protein